MIVILHHVSQHPVENDRLALSPDADSISIVAKEVFLAKKEYQYGI